MSRCQVYAITKAGYVRHFGDAEHAWGGAVAIWGTLAEEYGVVPPGQWPLVISDKAKAKETWRLIDRDDLHWWQRVMLLASFDRVIVPKEDLAILLAAIDCWIERYKPDSPCLYMQRALVQQISERRRYIGVCFNQTSVGGAPW